MRFHIPCIPGRHPTRANSHCAYTQKIVKFKKMMDALGHETIVYCGEETDVEGSVSCYPPFDDMPPWEPTDPAWIQANAAAAGAIVQRAEPEDFLLLIAGRCQQPLAQQLPGLMAVEFGIGYVGVFAEYRVYESYAWMHLVNGWMAGRDGKDGFDPDGRNYDTVIPNYFDPDDFPEGDGRGGYLAYLGRMNGRKGVKIAEETAKAAEMPLILAGNPGDHGKPSYGDYIGPVGPEDRAKLLTGAEALLVPTIYIEPFGGVAVEAMMCGTPAITSDFGAFPETVRQGVSGWRCHSLGEYVWAAQNAHQLDRSAVRAHAMGGYSLGKIGPAYDAYFQHLQGLRGLGFMDTTPRRPLARPE